MANKKISNLPAFSGTPASTDVVPMVDNSGTATTKKVSLANIVNLANVGNLRAANNLSDVANAGTARTSLGLGTAAVLATGIANTNVPKFTSGVADDDFLRVAGTDIEGRSASEVLSDVLAGNDLVNFNAGVNPQTGTAYTLLASDKGKVITLNNGSAITVTIPDSLGAGFTCTLIQIGAGDATFTAPGSATFTNRQSHTKTAGNKAVVSLVAYAADTFVLAGDTA